MVNLSPAPVLQFFDDNGDPLSGGKLYTYETGTTTPAVTYIDSTGLVANTNPIILNSRGEASVWVGATIYTFVLKTSTDVLIRTVNGVSADQLSFSLPLSSGSSLIGFLQSGTGAVARTVQDKLRESVYVEDFGAVGDGSTDDTVAIQKAIDSLILGGALNFGKGKIYRITSQLNCNTSEVTINGNDAYIDATALPAAVALNGVSALKVSGSISALAIPVTADITKGSKSITVSDTSTLRAGDLILIRSTTEVWPVGDVDWTARPGGIHFIRSIDSATGLTLQDGTFMDMAASGSPTVKKITPLKNINVNRLNVTMGGANKAQCGIIYAYCVDSRLEDCNIGFAEDTCFRAMYCFGGEVKGGKFTDATSPDTGTAPLRIVSGYGVHLYSATRNFTIKEAVLYKNRHGIACSGDTPVVACTIDNNHVCGSRAPVSNYDIDCHEECIGIEMINNKIVGSLDSNGSGGMQVRGQNCIVMGNTILNAHQYGILVQSYHTNPNGQDGVQVVNNTVDGARVVGIYINGSAATPGKNISVIGNTVRNVAGDGIRLNATYGGVVSGNIVLNTTSGSGIRLSGTSTSGDACTNIIVSHNRVESASIYGYNFSYADNLTVSEPMVRLATSAGIVYNNCSDVSQSGGYIESPSATTACVLLTSTSNIQISGAMMVGTGTPSSSAGITNAGTTLSNVSVVGCTMRNLQYPVRLTGTVDYVLVAANNSHQCAAAIDIAAAAHQVLANNL